MNFVPFEFCDSVCSILRDVAPIVKLVDVIIGARYEESWWYRISGPSGRMTFEELKKVNREFLYVNRVKFGLQEIDGPDSSLGEIKKVLKFTAPFFKMTTLEFFPPISYASCGDFRKVFPFVRNTYFWEIHLYGYSNWMRRFLTDQLEADMVRDLTFFCGGRVCDCRPMLDEFLLTKQFQGVNIDCLRTSFDQAFFAELLAKPFAGGPSIITANFACGLEEAKTVNPGQQVRSTSNRTITWQREDGVVITVRVADWPTFSKSTTFFIAFEKLSI